MAEEPDLGRVAATPVLAEHPVVVPVHLALRNGTMGWELAEYVAFIRTSPERDTAYTDTLGDMTMGSLGAIVAAVVIGLLWRRGVLRTSPHLGSGS